MVQGTFKLGVVIVVVLGVVALGWAIVLVRHMGLCYHAERQMGVRAMATKVWGSGAITSGQPGVYR